MWRHKCEALFRPSRVDKRFGSEITSVFQPSWSSRCNYEYIFVGVSSWKKNILITEIDPFPNFRRLEIMTKLSWMLQKIKIFNTLLINNSDLRSRSRDVLKTRFPTLQQLVIAVTLVRDKVYFSLFKHLPFQTGFQSHLDRARSKHIYLRLNKRRFFKWFFSRCTMCLVTT